MQCELGQEDAHKLANHKFNMVHPGIHSQPHTKIQLDIRLQSEFTFRVLSHGLQTSQVVHDVSTVMSDRSNPFCHVPGETRVSHHALRVFIVLSGCFQYGGLAPGCVLLCEPERRLHCTFRIGSVDPDRCWFVFWLWLIRWSTA